MWHHTHHFLNLYYVPVTCSPNREACGAGELVMWVTWPALDGGLQLKLKRWCHQTFRVATETRSALTFCEPGWGFFARLNMRSTCHTLRGWSVSNSSPIWKGNPVYGWGIFFLCSLTASGCSVACLWFTSASWTTEQTLRWKTEKN